ncbi:MAG: hypothetical protein Q8P67_18135, partial [archaeon]|nr:hypothetical protein [archaeon]
TSQLKEQAVREREQTERQMEATFSAQLRESQAGSARLRSQLHAAMQALERHGIDPISLEQLRSAEDCPAAAIEAGFESRVQSLRSALAAKKQALQGQIDEMQVVKETLVVLERGI